MTVPYSLRQQGWGLVDNGPEWRAPGSYINEDQARALNLPLGYARTQVVEFDTLHCEHCGGCQIKNPDRVRERGHCMSCMSYVCDVCWFKMSMPDYVHETFWGKVDKMKKARANLICV